MRNKIAIAISILLLAAMIFPISAASEILPQEFYGTAQYVNGTPIQSGAIIIAANQMGDEVGRFRLITDGTFGGPSKSDQRLLVNAQYDDRIYFYVNFVRVTNSYIQFSSADITRINLTVPLPVVPVLPPTTVETTPPLTTLIPTTTSLPSPTTTAIAVTSTQAPWEKLNLTQVEYEAAFPKFVPYTILGISVKTAADEVIMGSLLAAACAGIVGLIGLYLLLLRRKKGEERDDDSDTVQVPTEWGRPLRGNGAVRKIEEIKKSFTKEEINAIREGARQEALKELKIETPPKGVTIKRKEIVDTPAKKIIEDPLRKLEELKKKIIGEDEMEVGVEPKPEIVIKPPEEIKRIREEDVISETDNVVIKATPPSLPEPVKEEVKVEELVKNVLHEISEKEPVKEEAKAPEPVKDIPKEISKEEKLAEISKRFELMGIGIKKEVVGEKPPIPEQVVAKIVETPPVGKEVQAPKIEEKKKVEEPKVKQQSYKEEVNEMRRKLGLPADEDEE